MEKLSQEVVEDILLRLPVDSLVRCKYVSKHWLSLICNPSFVKLHLKLSKAKNKGTLILGSFTGLYFSIHDTESAVNENVDDHVLKLEYPFNLEAKIVRFIGSCDGLILILLSDSNMLLWNPATRDFKILPGGNIRHSGYFPLCGFGYDELTDDYKVVSHGIRMNSRVSEVSIYALRKDSWSVVKMNFSGEDYGTEHPGIFVSGILHWKVWRHHHTKLTKSSFIISLDLRDEKFREVSLPKLEDGMTSGDLGVLGGNLCVQYYSFMNHGFADVWVMRDYGRVESWTKLFCFKSQLLGSLSHIKLLQVLKNGDFLLRINGYDLFMYDAKHQRCKVISNTPFRIVEAEAYVQSIISLGAENGFKRKATRRCKRQRI
ncbi:hypothetical protein GIB67_043186 [Kingdonia uniflora]|uniref:F-box domain-containing protein n=1 Tax=Kingdonia uniflora TaxID=39325 RepID=A0A7J7NJG0_9MAGN|nr:hypothetical protein GIB67_043186 [Kingdonia uniflora]